ncbi:uncharacterized protein BT62DRAFT_1080981 [Guyanagaster necrorhizus]|uniref:Uncharacterized protein n=1 Tax=Guyanagaster necrorhizus TaxID=856835 RepID=A0A9P7VFY6_9AGAR|nr:uncharacterized protein BT62DRAFT_1080981 [Guyanagaster necrorhizus MCA 3950]KAG7440236.1 hypothetical protein BT62DRAFT_1080981 [Guyanagaster necrorhizus MCA 3950]
MPVLTGIPIRVLRVKVLVGVHLDEEEEVAVVAMSGTESADMMGAKIVMRIGGLDFLSDQQRYLAGTLLGDKILYTFGKLWSGKHTRCSVLLPYREDIAVFNCRDFGVFLAWILPPTSDPRVPSRYHGKLAPPPSNVLPPTIKNGDPGVESWKTSPRWSCQKVHHMRSEAADTAWKDRSAHSHNNLKDQRGCTDRGGRPGPGRNRRSELVDPVFRDYEDKESPPLGEARRRVYSTCLECVLNAFGCNHEGFRSRCSIGETLCTSQ